LGASARTAFPFHSSKERDRRFQANKWVGVGFVKWEPGRAEFEALYSFSARPCGSKGCLFRRQIKGPSRSLEKHSLTLVLGGARSGKSRYSEAMT
jgi:hypothetical protein